LLQRRIILQRNALNGLKNKPLELFSLIGIIADGKPHLHAVVSDCERAYAEHLEEGCRTLYLAEIVVLEVKSVDLTRIRDERNILKLKSGLEDRA